MDELERAQRTLGRALDKARAGEDPQLAGFVRERGEQLANLLNGLLRMSRIHSPDNHAFDQPVGELAKAVAELVERVGTLHLVAVEDQVYLNELRIRVGQAKQGQSLGAELAPHNVGGISFFGAPDDTQLRVILGLLASKPAPKKPRTALQTAIEKAGIKSVEMQVLHRFRMAGEEVEEEDSDLDPREVALRTMRVAEELFQNLAASRPPNVLPLRRAVTDLLTVGPGNDALFLVPSTSGPFGTHCLRVTQYALLIGQAAKLPDGLLQDLGMAAMLHDFGYALAGTQASAAGAQTKEQHTVAGLRLLVRQVGFHEAKVRRALTALDHHRDFSDPRGKPSLFGRIVRLACDYENWSRPSGAAAMPPAALGAMVAGANSRYDPVLLQLFFNRLGYYPPGTFLHLDDGRVAISTSVARSPETWAKPRGMVVRLADGTQPKQLTPVDLAQGGKVVRVLPPK